MGTETPNEPDWPTQDQDLFVYSEADIAEWAGELYAVVREFEHMDDADAEELVDYAVDLLTGDWLTDDNE